MNPLLVISLALISMAFNFECSANFDLEAPTAVSRFNQSSQAESKEILLAYQRSGTNLTIGILQILARKPVNTFNPLDEVNRLKLDLDHTKPPLWRTHTLEPLGNIDPYQSKLLILLRNYKECIVRNQKQELKQNIDPIHLRDIIVNGENDFLNYINNLNYFDKWENEQTKLIIYYEDLIKHPEVEIPKLLAFFNEDEVNFEGFISDYDFWKEKIMGSYQNQHGLEYSSGGDKEIFHSKEFPVGILREIDTHIKQQYPRLWERYLSRYETLGS